MRACGGSIAGWGSRGTLGAGLHPTRTHIVVTLIVLCNRVLASVHHHGNQSLYSGNHNNLYCSLHRYLCIITYITTRLLSGKNCVIYSAWLRLLSCYHGDVIVAFCCHGSSLMCVNVHVVTDIVNAPIESRIWEHNTNILQMCKKELNYCVQKIQYVLCTLLLLQMCLTINITRGGEPMLVWCWASVTDDWPTLGQHWLTAWCL